MGMLCGLGLTALFGVKGGCAIVLGDVGGCWCTLYHGVVLCGLAFWITLARWG